MTPEAWTRLVLDAYRQGLVEYEKSRSPLLTRALRQAEEGAWQTAPKDTHRPSELADKTRQLFFSILPNNEIKWSSLSYRAKSELLDAVHDSVIAACNILIEGESP
jgi:hypothetical protein